MGIVLSRRNNEQKWCGMCTKVHILALLAFPEKSDFFLNVPSKTYLFQENARKVSNGLF